MSSADSVTRWVVQLKAGDRAPVQQLWDRYFRRLAGLARHKLRGGPHPVADEEDVALSALDSFCRGAERDRFPQLTDRDSLWPLLVLITSRKAADLLEHERRKKRGGGGAAGRGPAATVESLDQVIGREPTPQFAAQVAEECRRLFECLDDAGLRCIARWRLEGYSTQEIADRLGCVPRTVERKLRRIRAVWAAQEHAP
jgi:DNA-directed RNA polymerase specialized sigma24 family protein